MYWYLIIIIICLFFSALFSGSETALFSISKIVLAQLKESKQKNINRIEKLLSNPPKLLGTILLSNLLVNMIFGWAPVSAHPEMIFFQRMAPIKIRGQSKILALGLR